MNGWHIRNDAGFSNQNLPVPANICFNDDDDDDDDDDENENNDYQHQQAEVGRMGRGGGGGGEAHIEQEQEQGQEQEEEEEEEEEWCFLCEYWDIDAESSQLHENEDNDDSDNEEAIGVVMDATLQDTKKEITELLYKHYGNVPDSILSKVVKIMYDSRIKEYCDHREWTETSIIRHPTVHMPTTSICQRERLREVRSLRRKVKKTRVCISIDGAPPAIETKGISMYIKLSREESRICSQIDSSVDKTNML